MQSHAAMNQEFCNQMVVADGLLLWLEPACVLPGRNVPFGSLSVVSLWAFACSCKSPAILLLWDCRRIRPSKPCYDIQDVAQHSLIDKGWCYGIKNIFRRSQTFWQGVFFVSPWQALDWCQKSELGWEQRGIWMSDAGMLDVLPGPCLHLAAKQKHPQCFWNHLLYALRAYIHCPLTSQRGMLFLF